MEGAQGEGNKVLPPSPPLFRVPTNEVSFQGGPSFMETPLVQLGPG